MENNKEILNLKPLYKKLVLFLVLVLAICVYFLYNKKDERSVLEREKDLQSLTDKSSPINTTLEDRSKDLQGLSKKSKPIEESQEDRLKDLEALSNQ